MKPPYDRFDKVRLNVLKELDDHCTIPLNKIAFNKIYDVVNLSVWSSSNSIQINLLNQELLSDHIINTELEKLYGRK